MPHSIVPMESDLPVAVPASGHRRGHARGWAVVEVGPDGTLGRAELVVANGPWEAVTRRWPATAPPRQVQAGELHLRLGALQADQGHLSAAAHTFRRALRSGLRGREQEECLGRLALAEAYQGELRNARVHAELAAPSTGDALLTGADSGPRVGEVHARLARAWIHLAHADEAECARLLDDLTADDEPPGCWLATLRLLLEAQLLVRCHRPDAALRLMAGATESASEAPETWCSAMVRVARADALLAAGDPRRCLESLTPLPITARVEAGVVTAAASLAVGDVRGADSVLRSVTACLDRTSVAVQVRAQLLEAHVAQARGREDAATALAGRALRTAAWEGLRAPVLDEWRWLRPLVDGDPALRRAHRAFLAPLRATAGPLPAPVHTAGPAYAREGPSPTLTERELEVLDLLALMCSTEEIAATLFVTSNTVKTHVKGIFAKLAVNRRVDAVRRGRQLGLC
jgi:DNA-binding CsgD family transcriptional regulator